MTVSRWHCHEMVSLHHIPAVAYLILEVDPDQRGLPGCLQLLEILEIYWNFVYPPGKINI